jgi:hypothetical protein
MKTLILLLLFTFPVSAYQDPWTDCNLWGDDIETVVLCRKAKMEQYWWEQQRRVEEQERAERKLKKDRR